MLLIYRCPHESVAVLESQLAVTESTLLGQWLTPGLRLKTPQPRNRSAKWNLEDNTVWYGQEEKLWINVAGCLCLSNTPLKF